MRSFGLRSLLLGVLLAFSSSAVATDLVIEDRTQNTLRVHRGVTAALPVQSSSAQVEGTLRIAHGDNFTAGKSAYKYHVFDAVGKATELKVAILPPSIRSGQLVIVNGQRVAASLQPQRITILAAPLRAQAVTSNSTLVILANFNNTGAQAYTRAQAQAQMAAVADFFNEVSYGQQTLAVTVTDWLPLNLAGTCDFTAIGTAADSAAVAANPAWDINNYKFIVYFFPSQPCGWKGLAYVGWGRAWINGSGAFVTSVVAHEMGHNFGLMHAGSLSCGAQAIGGACIVSEYGDPDSAMGNKGAAHFNAAQKALLNWIPASSIRTHTTGTATYDIAPLEKPGGAIYAVMVPTANPLRTYWLENRKEVVEVRVAQPFEWSAGADDTEILNVMLRDGDRYRDDVYAINVTVGVGGPAPPPPPPPGPPTAVDWYVDGTPGHTTATDANGSVWTLGVPAEYGFQLLRNGSWNAAAAGRGNLIIQKAGVVYSTSPTKRWWKWTDKKGAGDGGWNEVPQP